MATALDRPEEPGLLAVGMSHHTAPVVLRETLALDHDGVRQELSRLRTDGLAREALLLSTCNRVELYAVPEAGAARALRERVTHRRIGGARVDPHLYWLHGQQAVRHLFRVATSLDSLVVGEPQILGQVKDAVRLAESAGALGAVLQRLTQRSFWLAKQVRTHTDVGRHRVGIGNAGVQLAQQVFHTLEGRRALLVGTGEMGRQVARAMSGAGLEELLVCNRTFDKAVELARDFGGTPLRYERLVEYLQRVDVVITATAAQRPILSAADVKGALRARRYRNLFLVDLAVPRNIDPAVDDLDRAFLFNVDDLTRVVERGQQARQAASVEAEAMVEREAARFTRRLADLALNDGLGRIVRHVDQLRDVEIARTAKVLDHLDADDRQRVEAMMQAFQKRTMDGVLRQIRVAAREGDLHGVEVLMRAFGVSLEDLDG